MQPRYLLAAKTHSLKSVGRFFRKYKDHFGALFCIYYADFLAKEGPESEKRKLNQVRDRLMSTLALYHQQIRPKEIGKPLLTGHDLIEKVGLKPSPHFKKILEDIHEAYVEGRIQDKEAAVAWVKRRLESGKVKS